MYTITSLMSFVYELIPQLFAVAERLLFLFTQHANTTSACDNPEIMTLKYCLPCYLLIPTPGDSVKHVQG